MNREQFGEQPTSAPPGTFRPIKINLAPMDEWTGDGRRLEAAGRGLRPLPMAIFAQFKNAGHWEAELAGALHEVVFEDGWAKGKGWLLDNEAGHNVVLYRQAGAMTRNSVDLADVTAAWEIHDTGETDDFGPILEIRYNFTKWAIGATTLLAPIPAFADAGFEIDLSDEVMASMLEDRSELVLDDLTVELRFEEIIRDEIVASAGSLPSWAAFHQPEPTVPHKITVHADRTVTGHLALWDTCHVGIDKACVIPPKPKDEYASFNQPGVLTDEGMVSTGPIFLAGGHKGAPDGDFEAAYGGIENTWCDVRIIPGRFGPWVSGIVRPGVDEDKVYAARASRTSGHWKKGDLRAIVSVNSEGYPVAGDITAGFFSIDGGEVDELVAGFPDCFKATPPEFVVNLNASAEIVGDKAIVSVTDDDGHDMGSVEFDLDAILDEAELILALDDLDT